MKVLILAGDGAIQQVRLGYANAMAHIGMQCTIWQPNVKPAFDIFSELEPDILFCGTWEINEAILKNILERPHLQLILWGGNWGSFDKEINYTQDPILAINETEKIIVPQLVKNNNVHNVFTYYHQRWANVTHDYWKNIGIDPIGLPLAADLVNFGIVEEKQELKCDCSFVGGYWPYKAVNLNKFLLPLCYPQSKLKIKIFGYGGWPIAQYLGSIDNYLLPNLFRSSLINLNIFEPLAGKYGFDVNERYYKVLACGGFCISEYCESAAYDIFNNKEVAFVNTPTGLKDMIEHFVQHPEQRLPYIERGLHSIKHNHNYFIRLQQLLKVIGLTNHKLSINLDNTIRDLQND